MDKQDKKRKRVEVDEDNEKIEIVKVSKKPYSKKKGTLTRPTSYVMKGPNIAPDTYSVKMVYQMSTSLSSSSGAATHHVYRGNSVHDPDLTGTGTQPAGHDELSALYNRWRVMGSQIEVTAMSSNAVVPDDLVLRPATSSTPIGGTTEAFSEQPYAQRRTGFSKEQKFYLKQYMSTPKMFGVSKNQVKSEESYAGGVTNPDIDWYWLVSYQPVDKTTTQGIYLVVRITFYVTYYQRKVLDQS